MSPTVPAAIFWSFISKTEQARARFAHRPKNLQSCCRFFYTRDLIVLFLLHKLACRLQWAGPIAILLAALGFAGVLLSLLGDPSRYSAWLEPALVLVLWGMMLYAFLNLFRRIPPPVLPHDDFLTRLGSRIVLALYTLLAFLVVLVTLVLVWMSTRLILLD